HLAMLTPEIQTSPELAFSNPTRVRSSVLLPEPEPPRITTVSPRRTSKSMPCKISRSPYRTRTPFAEIIWVLPEAPLVEWIALMADLLRFLRDVEDESEDQIDNHYQEDRCHNRSGCGAADFFRTGSRGEAFLAADRGYDERENEALNEAADNVSHEEG